MGALGIAAVAAGLALAGTAQAAELKIVDVKAYVFLEHSGKFSDDIVGGPTLVDAPKGGAPGGDTATGVMIDFTFQGDRNFAPKYAVATVDLTQTGHLRPAGRDPQGLHQFSLRRRWGRAQGDLSRERHLRAADHQRPRRQDGEAGPARLLLHGSAGVELSGRRGGVSPS